MTSDRLAHMLDPIRRVFALPNALLVAVAFSALTLFVAVPADATRHQTPDDRPNVILILADDMGLGDVGKFNFGRTETPAIDRLADTGVWFHNAYAGSPVCTPSRAALLTGRYPHRTGAVTLSPKNFPELNRLHLDEVTVADLFSDGGYATGMVGKWHTGDGAAYHPMKRGFDEFAGATFMARDVDGYFRYTLDINGERKDFEGTYLTNEFTRRAIDFVQRHQSEPFFLHLAHYAPHRPLEAPQNVIDKYLARGYGEETATVYAMIEVMDDGIGELMTELDHLGLRENTIVIFASDNGPDPLVDRRFNHGMRGSKYTIYEGGVHVPLIVSWPGRLAPGERNAVVHLMDVLPTLLDLCGLDKPDDLDLDGVSLGAVLEETAATTDRPVFWQWNRGVPRYSHNAAMRDGPWKLVRPYTSRELLETESLETPVLYNVIDDPAEAVDRAGDHPERYDRMKTALEAWSTDVERSRTRDE